MAGGESSHREKIPYGRGELEIKIPRANFVATVMPQYKAPVKNEAEEFKRALENPLGTKRLPEIAKGKKNAVIVVNDITRPAKTYKMLPHLLAELKNAGLKESQITFLVAAGTHRENTPEEIAEMLGKDIPERFKVLNHRCQDDKNMVDFGKTKGGVPVVINRHYVEAELKILTSTIVPHQAAGFSGGRKSVIPGVASLTSIKTHHSFQMRSDKPAMGWVEGNPFHENAMAAVKMVGADFILNTVQNHQKEITYVVAGDVEKAWLEGMKRSREIYEVAIPRLADIVITSPGGFPKDIDLYQSQKSMAPAEVVVKDGGTVILPAECSDGIGPKGFYDWMAAASSPQEVIDRFIREGYSIGSSKAWLYSRCLQRAEVILVSKRLDDQTMKKMLSKRADTVEEAIAMAMAKHGKNAEIILMKNGSDMIPRLEGK